MKWLNRTLKLGLTKSTSEERKLPDRYPENIGGFYVENESCITCGAPEMEAPDLIEHSKKDEFGHCYFKKQPETDDEIDQAIHAVWVSCVGALRYGGRNQEIIKRLYQIGLGDKCDQSPDENWPILIRNRVTFKYNGSLIYLGNIIKKECLGLSNYVRIENEKNGTNYIQFLKRWTDGSFGIFYNLKKLENENFEILLSKEPDTYIEALISNAALVHDWIVKFEKSENIKWYEMDSSSDSYYLKPY